MAERLSPHLYIIHAAPHSTQLELDGGPPYSPFDLSHLIHHM